MKKKINSSREEKRKLILKDIMPAIELILFGIIMYVGLYYIKKYYNAGQLSCTRAQNMARGLISSMMTSMFTAIFLVFGNKSFKNDFFIYAIPVFILSRFFTILFTPYRFCNYEYNTTDGKKSTETVNINNGFNL